LPENGELVHTTLKPIGVTYYGKSIDTERDVLMDVSVEPATEQEIADTVRVMGGEDWALWIEALEAAGCLATGAKTVALTYIGPEVTWPIYWHGTIGRAKQHLESTAERLRERYASRGLGAQVAVMKSVVTQASAAIPVIPLYVSLVFRIMQQKGLQEEPVDQMNRLFRERLYRSDAAAPLADAEGRLRLDDRELDAEVQRACKELWSRVTSENLFELTDYTGYKRRFLQLFGFARSDVDYEADVDTGTGFDCIQL
jgi:enoyl-[acyl-carrier protein] reductase/trans-2-enoyl-CoA reductase (NAD+)